MNIVWPKGLLRFLSGSLWGSPRLIWKIPRLPRDNKYRIMSARVEARRFT